MARALLLLLASTGCHSILGIGDFTTKADASSGGDDDAATDANEPDGVPADARTCFGTLTSICLTTLPTTPIAIKTDINTDTDPRCIATAQPGGPTLCVIAGTTIQVEEHAAITGTRPLVLLALDTITIDNVLDASSTTVPMPRLGPDARAACDPSANGLNSAGGKGGSGGAGGSFGTVGGLGGPSDQKPGGVPGPMVSLTAIRGGCGGGKGGDRDQGASGGTAAASGGAVALIAGSQIAITTNGAVYASGAGGGAGNTMMGSQGGAGGGGGSGGLIVLDAPAIHVLGIVAANGGGGGGGGDCCAGHPGQDGTTEQYSMAAAGGLREGTVHGGDGGAGGARATAPGSGVQPNSGGGGGGGGGSVGIVLVHGTITGTQISPAATTN